MSAGALDEFARIRKFFLPLAGPGALGLLDDAAILDCGAGRRLVMTTDALVAGVHFLADDPANLVAKKLLRVNLSDLAAMGARPLVYLMTTALPAECGEEWLAGFAEGLAEDQQRFGIQLLGGDSVATPGPAALSLTAIGEVAAGREVRRSGARAGDRIWISGTVGDAFLGLAALRGRYAELAPDERDFLVGRFRVPEPRSLLGPRLAGIADAMIDVSDGLVADLGHICETSGVGAVVDLEALPLSVPARRLVAADPALRPQLASGGDDYELLFAAPPEKDADVAALGREAGVAVTAIGRIEAGSTVRVVDRAGRPVAIEQPGYRHF